MSTVSSKTWEKVMVSQHCSYVFHISKCVKKVLAFGIIAWSHFPASGQGKSIHD